jgi:KDO2-lipid IV(A) lauroyltransferase
VGAVTGQPVVRDDHDLPLITARDLAWAIYLYPLRGLARVSSRASSALIWLGTPLYRLMARSRRAEVRKLLADAFGSELSSAELDAISRRYPRNFTRRIADDLMLERGDKGIRCRSFSGRENLDEALAARRGVLFVTLHWYAGQAAKHHLASLGYPVLTVRKREIQYGSSVSRFGERLLEPVYERFARAVIRDEVYVEDRHCSLEILRRLRGGGIVELHLDVPHSGHVIEMPLLGRRVGVPAGALHLARVTGCAVLPMVARGGARSLELQIDPPVELDRTLLMKEFCQRYLPVLVRILEARVRERPDAWEPWSVLKERS